MSEKKSDRPSGEAIWIHKKHNFDTKEQWHCRNVNKKLIHFFLYLIRNMNSPLAFCYLILLYIRKHHFMKCLAPQLRHWENHLESSRVFLALAEFWHTVWKNRTRVSPFCCIIIQTIYIEITKLHKFWVSKLQMVSENVLLHWKWNKQMLSHRILSLDNCWQHKIEFIVHENEHNAVIGS